MVRMGWLTKASGQTTFISRSFTTRFLFSWQSDRKMSDGKCLYPLFFNKNNIPGITEVKRLT
jgi:hypothetical protein